MSALAGAGELIGPYQTIQLLGRGSLGEVWLAQECGSENLVALKTIPYDTSQSHEAVARARDTVLREAELLRRLRHPHVVSCVQVCWDADFFGVWMALELMKGGSVRNLIDCRRHLSAGPFDATFVRRLFAEIGSALCYIHSQGVLHRDVKPANILITLQAPPVMKLADFGVSKLLEATGHAQSRVGTQYYLSPEIASGRPYGQASDAWALGVCLYELATLQRPFVAGNPMALARLICEEPFPSLPSGLASDLAQAITGLLEKDVDRRTTLQVALSVSDAIAELVPAESTSVPLVCEVEELCEVENLPPTPHQTEAHYPPQSFEKPKDGWAAEAPEPEGADRRKRRDREKDRGGGWWTSFTSVLRPARSKEVTLVDAFSVK